MEGDAAAALDTRLRPGQRDAPFARHGGGEGSVPPMRRSTLDREPSCATPSPYPLPKGRGEDLSGGEGRVSREGEGRVARGHCALRLGFRQIKGLAEKDAIALIHARAAGYA